MSDKAERSGGCLCGAVRFKAVPKEDAVGACHCGMCRRWSGGVFLALDCQDGVKFESDEALQVYRSSEWGERGFCGKCGTSLFWKMHGQDHYIFSAQAFDVLDALTLDHEIFIDEKPGYYAFAGDRKKMTGEEVFAAFAHDETTDG